jgi:hypothetical protein
MHSKSLLVTLDDLGTSRVDSVAIWTDRLAFDFEGFRDAFDRLDLQIKIKIKIKMLTRMAQGDGDHFQQISCAYEFYRYVRSIQRSIQAFAFLIIMSSSPSRSNTDQRRLALTESSRELARQATRNEKEVVQASHARHIELFVNFGEIKKVVCQDATPEKLRAFTMFVKQIVYTRITALTKGFSVMNRSLLTSNDVDKMLDHAEVHFPFTFNYQLPLVTTDLTREDVPKEKKLAALWSMIGSFGKRNKDYCAAFATVVALSLWVVPLQAASSRFFKRWAFRSVRLRCEMKCGV